MVITRFAPSPTGMLHIGSARTALFSYLFAKKNNGKFLLRIEDTDLQRSTQEAVDAILDGMDWLGLKWDEDVVFQSKNIEHHKEAVNFLLKTGKAYYAYDDKDQIAHEREMAEKNGRIYKYNPIWRDYQGDVPANIPPVVRFKIPSGKTVVHDHVRGIVEFNNSEIEDFVILRSDGTPVYMLAVVVDDANMNVTHIIRGDDHLGNTPKQIMLYQALEKKVPEFAHIPLIHDIEGKKLSKRKNAVSTLEYQNMGYLNEALINYLLRLGWSHENKEIFTKNEMIELFNLEGIGKSPSRFDMQKLDFINLQYLQNLKNEEILNLIKPKMKNLLKKDLSTIEENRLLIVMNDLKKNKNLNTIAEDAIPYCDVKFTIDSTLLDVIKNQKDILSKFKDALITLSFQSIEIKDAITSFLKDNSLTFKDLGVPVRIALIGKTHAASLATILEALGKEESIRRIENVL